MKRQGWAFLGEIVAGIVAVVAALRGNLLWAAAGAVFAVGAAIAARVWSRKDPGPMPYFMRGLLFTPRGPHSPQHLKRILKPLPGERILEVGPGVGIHAIPVASALLPDGALDAIDVQQEMLDELERRAAKANIKNIVARQGDAQKLPYPDNAFDAAYLIAVLGEVLDRSTALSELRRVLKPGGRLVIGEVVIDPDYIPLPTLQEIAEGVGMIFERKAGPGISYLAVFRASVAAELESSGRAVSKWT